jgi:hypothetical protein
VLRDMAPTPTTNLGVMELFAGAMGAFRRPAAHRPGDYADPSEAAQVVLGADVQLHMHDRIAGASVA